MASAAAPAGHVGEFEERAVPSRCFCCPPKALLHGPRVGLLQGSCSPALSLAARCLPRLLAAAPAVQHRRAPATLGLLLLALLLVMVLLMLLAQLLPLLPDPLLPAGPPMLPPPL